MSETPPYDIEITRVLDAPPERVCGVWEGIPGRAEAWPSSLRVELHGADGTTRLVVREGPHPPGMADLGRQAWEMMLPKLDSLLSR